MGYIGSVVTYMVADRVTRFRLRRRLHRRL